MAYSKVAVSLPADLLAWLDQLAAARQQSRSEIVREFLEEQRAHEEFEQLVAEWQPYYDEVNAERVAMSEAFLAISTLPHLEWNSEAENELPATG